MATTLGFTPQGWLDVPETRPATEYIDGELVQKMSPRPLHFLLAGELLVRVLAWCKQTGLGRGGPEGDIDLHLPDGSRARVVPDLVYISYADVPKGALIPMGVPQRPPTVAFEILSPNDPNRPTVRRKIELYRAMNATVVVVDERQRSVTVYAGPQRTRHCSGDIVEIGAMPGFALDVDAYFRDAELDVT